MNSFFIYHINKGVTISNETADLGHASVNCEKDPGGSYTESDSVLDLNTYGLTNDVLSAYGMKRDALKIIQKRDIYENYGGTNLFFLNYDEKELLKEIELHNGFEINVQSVTLHFHMDFQDAKFQLATISANLRELSPGEVFFEDLKLTISNAVAMGSGGDELAYFYCAKDIGHLFEY